MPISNRNLSINHLVRPLGLAFAAMLVASIAPCAVKVRSVPVPPEMRGTQFAVTVNGKPVDVAHAAAGYDYVSFDITGPVDVAITAKADTTSRPVESSANAPEPKTAGQRGFWADGVDIQPWRLGIRPTRSGNIIRFHLDGPAKLSISRPGDFLNHAQMLFLFAGMPPAPPPVSRRGVGGAQVIAPGVYRQSLNPKSGDTLYLSPGAVIFGSLNLFDVQNVKVLGRGTIVYDGPQNPADDEGWMQKPDWHCIGMKDAHRIEIDGLTCIVRSRTWSIQMKDSSDIVYNDLRVIGGNPGNANQDGMDWLGGGDTVVRDAFFRASDDVFAMQGNWDGYAEEDMVRPGHDVQNILVERSVLSTSISNIVRAGWPRKLLNSRNFTLRDSDIVHGGIGGCGLPFALLAYWGAEGARGESSSYTFQNLFLDDWYSLLQIEQEEPRLRGFTFHNIWALDQPPLVTSLLQGQVEDVRLENIKLGQTPLTSDVELPLIVTAGAEEPHYAAGDHGIQASFRISPAILEPGIQVRFTAQAMPHASYTWLFGDGSAAHGRIVTHTFPDADGTALDGTALGAGRFRVLLRVQDRAGHQDWASQDAVVVARWHDAVHLTSDQSRPGATTPTAPGLNYLVYPGTWPALPNLAAERATSANVANNFGSVAINFGQADTRGFTRYAIAYDGLIDVPTDGGYTFMLLDRDGARLIVDGVDLAQTGPPFAQVCGSPGNAVRIARGSLGLRAGKHTIRLEALHTMSEGAARLLWEGPGIGLNDVPAVFSHRAVDTVAPAERGTTGKP